MRFEIQAGVSNEPMEVRILVLGQRLSRKEIERSRARFSHQAIQHRKVIAERLPRRGAGNDRGVSTSSRLLIGFPLVRIEGGDSACGEPFDQSWVQLARNLNRPRRRRWNRVPTGNTLSEARVGTQLADQDINLSHRAESPEY